MTKYQWERQLKKGMSSLPKSEQQRVLDYYNELFADKIEFKMREEDIISEFGNPYEVANCLVADYYSENDSRRQNKNRHRADEYDERESGRNSNRNKNDDLDDFFETVEIPYRNRSNDRDRYRDDFGQRDREYRTNQPSQAGHEKTVSNTANVLGAVVLACIFVYVSIVMWSTAIGFFSAGVGMLVAGVIALLYAIGQIIAGATFGMILLGAALLVFGLGLLLVVGISSLFKVMAKACKSMFGLVKNVARGGGAK